MLDFRHLRQDLPDPDRICQIWQTQPKVPKLPNLRICQISRSPDLQMSKSPDRQISEMPNSQKFRNFQKSQKSQKCAIFRKSRNSGNPDFPLSRFPNLRSARTAKKQPLADSVTQMSLATSAQRAKGQFSFPPTFITAGYYQPQGVCEPHLYHSQPWFISSFNSLTISESNDDRNPDLQCDESNFDLQVCKQL